MTEISFPGPGSAASLPSDVEGKLAALVARGPKIFCDQCGQRNDIENYFFCLHCDSNCCWQCLREKPLVSQNGGSFAACRCHDVLRSFDDWIHQSKA